MPDIQTTVTAVVGTVTPVGLAVGWWFRRRDSQKDPIPKESAAVALATSGVALMQTVADRLDERLKGLEAEVGELRREQVHMRLTLSAAARYIEKLLRWAKSDTRPPIPHLPDDLRDLIDPSLHD